MLTVNFHTLTSPSHGTLSQKRRVRSETKCLKEIENKHCYLTAHTASDQNRSEASDQNRTASEFLERYFF